MALKRESLKAMGLSEEQISAIIEMHRETVDGLKAEVDSANQKVEKFDEVTKKLKEYESSEDWKKKYDDEHDAFEKFKTETEQKAVRIAKEDAFVKLLKELNISEKRIPAILKVTDLDSAIELGKDGSVKNAEKVKESAKAEWADFIVTESEKGAEVNNPPANNGGNTFDQMPLVDKMKYANEHPNDQSVRDWLNK